MAPSEGAEIKEEKIMAKQKRVVKLKVDLGVLTEILGLPGRIIRVKGADWWDSETEFVLEGSEFPVAELGRIIPEIEAQFNVLLVRELLEMSRGRLAVEDLRGARVLYRPTWKFQKGDTSLNE